MITRLRKWGNSLGVRIPKGLAQDANVDEGATVDVTLEDGRLVIAPVDPARYDLAKMLDRVTPKNVHDEVDFGKPAGGEVW